ncbi:MAG: hypothetical protein FWF86_08345 [Clostridia bacterium]|nr:hypothetical protein [Clostridia bacterium]
MTVAMTAAVFHIFVDSLEMIRPTGVTLKILPLPWVAARIAAVTAATC